MKIRTGFVSNSSSSSFIVNPAKFANTKAVAKSMLEYNLELVTEGNRRNCYGTEETATIASSELNLQFLMQSLDQIPAEDMPIMFLCRDDTRIMRVGSDIYVQASIHTFYDIDGFNFNEDAQDAFYRKEVINYYFPKWQVVAREAEDKDLRGSEHYCKKHWTNKLVINGQVVCPECWQKAKNIEVSE